MEEPQKNAKERLYDKIPLNAKQMDVVIAILLAALMIVFVLGVLKGNGIIK